jgi:hypothetical protein
MKLVARSELPTQVIQCLCETAPSHLSIGDRLFRLTEPLLNAIVETLDVIKDV